MVGIVKPGTHGKIHVLATKLLLVEGSYLLGSSGWQACPHTPSSSWVVPFMWGKGNQQKNLPLSHSQKFLAYSHADGLGGSPFSRTRIIIVFPHVGEFSLHYPTHTETLFIPIFTHLLLFCRYVLPLACSEH